MKVVVAPQAFKGSLTAQEAARAIAQGVRRAAPQAQVVLLPMADGGDGTLEVLVEATGGAYRRARVTGPLGEPVEAPWGILGDGATAVIESARACGLVLAPTERRDPRVTTTRGVGELVRHALDAGFRRIIIGLGGSATNDGGAGMAQALGVRLLDCRGRDLLPGGAALLALVRIDVSGLDPRLRQAQIIGAVDVSNPLCGPQGAARIYGPQKGASPEVVELLDRALARLAAVAHRNLGMDLQGLESGGAAGGLGAGLVAFLGARLEPGAGLVCQAIGLERHLEGADLVIVGEGRLDAQTAFNKGPGVVARAAARRGIPVLAMAGALGPGYQELHRLGFTRMAALTDGGVSPQETMQAGAALLTLRTEEAMRTLTGRGA